MADALSPAELYDRLRRGEPLTLLDVRNRDEFETWRIDAPETVQTPYAEFLSAKVRDGVPQLAESLDLEEPVVAVCPRGEASDRVADLLRDAGVDAVNLEGGMNGWARVYVAREIEGSDETVVQYERPSSGCLSYLVVSGDEAAVVDPLRAFADRYVEDARERGAELRYAVDTHVHADHVSGIREVAEASEAEPVLPSGARERGLAFDAKPVEDGDELRVGETALTAVHAPGHTSEMTVYRLGNTLFSADTLFLDGVGRPDLEREARRASERADEGDGAPQESSSGEPASADPATGSAGASELAGDLYGTLHERLLALPETTIVAPGHVHVRTPRADDGTFTARLATVRESVPLLELDRERFVERVAGDLPPRPANYEEIVAVNLGRREVEEETAFELELGPNNCAV
ncbi:MBL fold metallo-hydrolase [Haladaptatus salinisoli]|uniref:MBL fold metallo-hydrolase n=1 Tax=Haladaptatus salinisoli TaxID=2884876 RepID=UPI001D0B7F83|nr:MBL fold metallo-hydrolase [Haladaptatus salinisoli]